MTTDEICNLPVKDIADKNCALFMWVTSPLLPDGLKVIKSWGFEYKTIGFIWIKLAPKSTKMFFGLGYYTHPNAEVCLFARKGILKPEDRTIYQVHYDNMRGHSTKPHLFREQIVKLFGDLPRIELFARQKAEGWDVWGNEV